LGFSPKSIRAFKQGHFIWAKAQATFRSADFREKARKDFLSRFFVRVCVVCVLAKRLSRPFGALGLVGGKPRAALADSLALGWLATGLWP
jgi:hypothetical protein